MLRIAQILTIALSSILCAIPAVADAVGDGFEAARNGDFEQALELLKEPAEQGNAYAQYALGMMYHNGEGVVQDYAEAVKWYTLAAEQGYADAQRMLGFMHNNGEGVAQNYAEAVKWYTLAAEQGDAYAQYNLSLMYYNGTGVVQDYVLAHMWANIAAAGGVENGAALRDFIATKLAPADLRIAQTMASECMASNYENCGY